MLRGEAANTTFIGFGVTHRGSNQRVIAYCTRGEHADHYTIDVVDGIWNKGSVTYDNLIHLLLSYSLLLSKYTLIHGTICGVMVNVFPANEFRHAFNSWSDQIKM